MPLSSGLSIHDDTKHKGSAKRGAASGVAGLGGDARLNFLEMHLSCNEYSNHLGAVDNYIETNVSGNGTVNSDAANHEMDLSSGAGANGGSSYNEKSGHILTTTPHICSVLVQNISIGAGADRACLIGFGEMFPATRYGDNATFMCSSAGVWSINTIQGGSWTSVNIAAIGNGDLLTIVATSAEVNFLVNGVSVGILTTDIPTAALRSGVTLETYNGGATSAMLISVDMLSVKRYV